MTKRRKGQARNKRTGEAALPPAERHHQNHRCERASALLPAETLESLSTSIKQSGGEITSSSRSNSRTRLHLSCRLHSGHSWLFHGRRGGGIRLQRTKGKSVP